MVGADDFKGKVLDVDSVDIEFSDLPKSFVWRAGSIHSYKFVSVLSLSSGDKLLWESTSGLSTSQSDALTVKKEGVIAASYGGTFSSPNASLYPLTYVGLAIVAGTILTVVVALAMQKKKAKKSKKKAV